MHKSRIFNITFEACKVITDNILSFLENSFQKKDKHKVTFEHSAFSIGMISAKIWIIPNLPGPLHPVKNSFFAFFILSMQIDL